MIQVQIIKEFNRRTEYKVLREWMPVTESNLQGLKPGICIFPGILFTKLTEIQRKSLTNWVRQWGNQLLLVPPWWEVNISEYLNLATSVQLEELSTVYKGIPVEIVLLTKIPAKWQVGQGGIVTIDARHDSGSGFMTITTVPLLDYRLASQEDVLKNMLLDLLQPVQVGTLEVKEKQEISQVQLNVLLLAAAGIDITCNLEDKVYEYLTVKTDGMDEQQLRSQLQYSAFLDDQYRATEKVYNLLYVKGYRAFIRELRKRGEAGDW